MRPLAEKGDWPAFGAAFRASEQRLAAGRRNLPPSGGPLVSAVAAALVQKISQPAFLQAVRANGDYLRQRLAGIRAAWHSVLGIRHHGSHGH